ncbi:MAG: thiol-disulfide oxidoreductase DCC family protein [Flectobacillus sp.]|uniref:thiol-disulfide oxidoreductase DCC family protein n=1 Tax=Flectobacillus sp. TaxID=50419 RepID=UPI003B9A2FE7
MKTANSDSPDFDLILFDGVCNFCNSSINFVIEHDINKRFRFASLQSDFGQSILKQYAINQQDFDSVVLIQNNQIFQKSEAALRIAKHLQGFWSYFYFLRWIPRRLRDVGYDLVAKNRYRIFGKSEACRIPSPELRERFLG